MRTLTLLFIFASLFLFGCGPKSSPKTEAEQIEEQKKAQQQADDAERQMRKEQQKKN